jgi:hypothetical protein
MDKPTAENMSRETLIEENRTLRAEGQMVADALKRKHGYLERIAKEISEGGIMCKDLQGQIKETINSLEANHPEQALVQSQQALELAAKLFDFMFKRPLFV